MVTETIRGLQKYWNKRSHTYSKSNIEELNNYKGEVWMNIILNNAPKKERLKVLDIGTGPGLFAILLAAAGHEVTAVDVSEEMLNHAAENAKEFEVEINFKKINGIKLPFEQGTFDLIVSRNVLWNIEKPEEALKEWKRTLNKEGRIVYFDANWYLYLFDEKQKKLVENDRAEVEKIYGQKYEHTDELEFLENLAKKLELSNKYRPAWDKEVVPKCGFEILKIHENIGEFVWDKKEQISYKSTPIFMVVAR